jgi:predicted small lipoprotein YifL
MRTIGYGLCAAILMVSLVGCGGGGPPVGPPAEDASAPPEAAPGSAPEMQKGGSAPAPEKAP